MTGNETFAAKMDRLRRTTRGCLAQRAAEVAVRGRLQTETDAELASDVAREAAAIRDLAGEAAAYLKVQKVPTAPACDYSETSLIRQPSFLRQAQYATLPVWMIRTGRTAVDKFAVPVSGHGVATQLHGYALGHQGTLYSVSGPENIANGPRVFPTVRALTDEQVVNPDGMNFISAKDRWEAMFTDFVELNVR